MKTRKLFTAGILALGLMTACSNEDEPNVNNGNGNGETTYAQIAINMVSPNTPMTKVEGNTGDTNVGTEAEQTVTNLTVVLTDANNIVQEIYPNQTLKTGGTIAADRATEPFEIPAGNYKVYVLANYSSGLAETIARGSDLASAFTISNFAQFTVANNFLMANAVMPTGTTDFSTDATDKEVDDDLTEEAEGENVHLIKVDLERVVSKVTFDQSKTTFEVKDANDTKIASTTLNGAALINLNKKMYLVREAKAATNAPSGVSDWIYPEDPNYNHKLTDATTDATWIADNFDKTSAPAQDFNSDFSAATFYCPENTMNGGSQQHGQTTGVVYKATYTPEANAYTSLAAQNGTSTYDKLFEAVLGLVGKDAAITDAIFTTADSENAANFYAYNGLIFKNQNAAILYKAIAEDKTAEDPSDKDARAKAINTQFTTWKSSVPADVLKYAEGVSYYTAWIRHNPDADAGNMEQDKYGVVRNHWYELTVNSISGLGYNEPTYENPEDPDDKAVANIQVAATIKPWRIVKQSVDL